MPKNLEIALLLDFYGDMLTEKQRDVVELYYNEIGRASCRERVFRAV